MRSLLTAGLMLCAAACGQTPEVPRPTLENNGSPMRIALECTPEEMRDQGLTCPFEEPCPVYLELSGLETAGNKIFATGNVHTQTVTLASVLLASADAGKSWTEPHPRIRSAVLDQLQFLDFESGWASGHYLHGSPRDPFLLLTTDGGKSWRARPIFSESRAGLIDHFRFESKSKGTVWIDRSDAGEPERSWEIYESMTGGESWMVREISDKPIRAEKRSSPADWRLRADGPTKSYHIEKRTGERWEFVAAFLVEVGACKEPEAVLPEPPPSQPAQPEATPSFETAPVPEAPKPRAKPPTLKRPPQ